MATMTTTKSYYRTIGSVRGDCGHHHRTLSGAARCLRRDEAGCASQGGYSDRSVELVISYEPHECPVPDSRGTVAGALVYAPTGRFAVIPPEGDDPSCWMPDATIPEGVEMDDWIEACEEAAESAVARGVAGEIEIAIELDDI